MELSIEQQIEAARLKSAIANHANQIAGVELTILQKQVEIEKLRKDASIHQTQQQEKESELKALLASQKGKA